jgi:ubiquinone/menaquinone biosynthesis C-methylase UbiE
VSIDVSGIKQGQRMMWSTGNYPEVARRIESVAELLAERVGAGPGVEMLDVATGSGNVAIAAAQRGANVTGLDLTPELLEAARRRAAEADLDVRFIEGDAEELPFESDSFDRVASCFGVMFAPRHEQAQASLCGSRVRVGRSGSPPGLPRD